MIINGTANEAGDAILIKLVEPYKKVKAILSFIDETIGEDSNNYFSKWFRWSTDNKNFSDFIQLTNYNLSNLELDPNNDFWIEYKYEVEQIETGNTLQFKSIALEVITDSGKLQQVVQVSVSACDPSASGCFGNLIIEECCDTDNIFKPYAWLNGFNCFYDQLTSIVNKIFGHCVRYYKIEPDKESEDVILREHSIFNRSKVRDIQVLVPDNNFPTNDFQFDPFQGMGFEGFEIHITRQEFENAFGPKSRPRERDAIYFPINQRMYTVNSVALADEINALHTYYKVKLRKFEDSQNIFDTTEIENELNNLVVNMDDVFADKTKDEILKVTKPQQYKTIGINDNDYIRSEINSSLIISDEKINNNWTIVSKNYYDLTKVKSNTVAVKYKLKSYLSLNDDLAITFWFRPKFAVQKPKINIVSFSNDGGYLKIMTAIDNGYKIGDYVEIYGSNIYSKSIYKIINVLNTKEFIIDINYDANAVVLPGVTKVRFKERAPVLYGYNLSNNTNIGMSIDLFEGYIVVSINSNRYSIYLDQNYDKNLWYSSVINLSNNFKQLSVYLYKLEKTQTYTMPQNEDSSLTKIKYENILLNNKVQFDSNDYWSLLGSPIHLTNIRLFTKIIEEESHNATLNQYVIRDTHLALLIDNAIPQLRLAKFSNPR